MKSTNRSWPLVWLLAVAPVVNAGEDSAASDQATAPAIPEAPHIVGGIDDGTRAPVVPKPPPPELNILNTVEYVLPREGRSIIVHHVAPPDLSIPDPPPPPPEIDTTSPEYQAELAALRAIRPRITMFPISVTVYDHAVSFVRWSHREEGAAQPANQPRLRVVPPGNGQAAEQAAVPPSEYEIVSNIDWNVFSGVTGIAAGDREYPFFMFLGNSDTRKTSRFWSEVVPDHPPLPVDGPGFVVTKGDPTNADALAFIRAVHEIYRTDSQRLLEAYASRERHRLEQEAWLKAHPPQPKDTVVSFWNVPAEQAARIREAQP